MPLHDTPEESFYELIECSNRLLDDPNFTGFQKMRRNDEVHRLTPYKTSSLIIMTEILGKNDT